MFKFGDRAWSYIVAVAVTMLALLLMISFNPWLKTFETPFLLFFGAITVSAWYGGRGPGLVSTLLSALLINYILFSPHYQISLDLINNLRMLLFFIQGCAISYFCGALRIAQKRVLVNLQQLQESGEALRNSEAIASLRVQELETFMETVPVGVWIARDPQCHEMSANRTAYKIMRVPFGSVATATPADGRNPFKFKQRKNGQDFLPSELPVQRAARTRQEVEEEIELVFDDGEVLYLYGKAVPLKDDSGEVRGAIGAFLDVSERKLVEKALRDSERRIASLAELSPVGIYRSDRYGNITYVNDRCCEITGLAPEESLGLDGVRAIHPDDRERVLSEWLQAVENKLPFRSEYRFLHADGKIRWAIGQAMPETDSQEQVIGYIATVTDISERKIAELALRKSEEKFRTISNAAPALVWVCSPKGENIFFNDRWYEFTGQTEAEAIGRGWTQTMHPEDTA
jgi:PAS domain S-box-containing protein